LSAAVKSEAAKAAARKTAAAKKRLSRGTVSNTNLKSCKLMLWYLLWYFIDTTSKHPSQESPNSTSLSCFFFCYSKLEKGPYSRINGVCSEMELYRGIVARHISNSGGAGAGEKASRRCVNSGI